MNILYIAFVYNEIKYIEDVVRYYKRQGLRLYFIDNMSTDGTYEWLLDNNIECSRFDTNDSFDLRLLQPEVQRIIHFKKPDWVVYGSADLYYVFNDTVYDEIKKANNQGYNMLSIPCYGAQNTSEQFNTPLYKYFTRGMYWKELRMICKYDASFSMNGDMLLLSNYRVKYVDGIMVNYGACKPIDEQKEKLKRRQKAWDNGLRPNTGRHFKRGEFKNWTWSTNETIDFLATTHWRHFKQLMNER